MSTYAWEDEMICNVTAICKESVKQWAQLIETLGVPYPIRTEWCTTYLKEVRQLMSEMYNDLEERQKNMTKVITELKNKIGEAAYHLGITPEFASESNLYQDEVKLKSYLAFLEEQITKKQEEVVKLLARQEKICATLGKPQRVLQDKPLPSNIELESFMVYVESLEEECFLREEKYTTIQCELQNLAAEIDYEPANEFEIRILRHNDVPFAVHDKNMIYLTAFEQSLKQHANNIESEVAIFMDNIRQLWKTLDTDEKYCIAFQAAHSGLKKQNVTALKSEIKRLQDLKRANLHMLIKRLRDQLVVQWDICHFSEQQRQLFDTFNDDMYTESMLTTFQNEVHKVTTFYEDNQLLFESLSKFESTWRRVDELETPEQGQNRFRNRGGKLLIEEKERKVAKKRLEKLQQSIVKMADEYFAAKQEEFTYEGISVEEYFKSFEAKDELRLAKTTSKSGLAITKSSNLLEGSKSAQKVLRPVPQTGSHHSPNSRSPTKGDSFSYRKPTKSSAAKISDSSKSVPTKRCNPIVSGADKLKKDAVVAKLKERTKLIRQLHQDNTLDDLVELHDYKHFQKIVDTSMPALLNDTMDVRGNESKVINTNQYENESPLAYALSPTQSTSRIEMHNDENKAPSTPSSSFQNVTVRRLKLHKNDQDLSNS